MADLEKADTRKLAKEWNLPVFNKPESQDICFIPDNDYKGFLEKEQKDIFKPGDFVDESGRVIGRHQGIAGCAVGGRRGLGLGGGGGGCGGAGGGGDGGNRAGGQGGSVRRRA